MPSFILNRGRINSRDMRASDKVRAPHLPGSAQNNPPAEASGSAPSLSPWVPSPRAGGWGMEKDAAGSLFPHLSGPGYPGTALASLLSHHLVSSHWPARAPILLFPVPLATSPLALAATGLPLLIFSLSISYFDI